MAGEEDVILFVVSPPREAAKKSIWPSLAYDSYHALIHSREPIRLATCTNPPCITSIQLPLLYQTHLTIQTDKRHLHKPTVIKWCEIASCTCHTIQSTLPSAPITVQHHHWRKKCHQSNTLLANFISTIALLAIARYK